MKRTILFIGMIVLAALFTLSSCDMILNAVYPEYNPDNGGENKVVVSIEINTASIDVNMYALKVALVPLRENENGFELKIEEAWIQEFWGMDKIDFAFTNLGKNAYQAFTWIETIDNNFKPDADEPSNILSGMTQDGFVFNIFDFREGDQSRQYVAATYLDQYTRMDFTYLEKWNTGSTITDNSFTLYGPGTISRSSPGDGYFYVYPADSGNVPNDIYFQVLNGNYYTQSYNGTYGWQMLDDNAYNHYSVSFNLNFNNVYPALSDATWDSGYMIVQVYVVYDTGDTWQNEVWIYLDNSDSGTYYNLHFVPQYSNIAPNGYAYVYLVDLTDGNTLAYNSAYLNQDGYYSFDFYSIKDPVDRDQQLLVYLYDQYWNYLGYYTKDLTGEISGDVYYYGNNDGTISTSSSTTYGLTVNVNVSSCANGYAYVYLFDYTYGSTLAYSSTYLDGYGYYSFNMGTVTDTSTTDQTVGVYLYDYNWNYIGYYSYNLTGSQSGTVNVELYYDGYNYNYSQY